jgi:hypothetical protein
MIAACSLHLAGSLFGLLFNPDDGGSTFHRKMCKLLYDDTAQHPRQYYYSCLIFQNFTAPEHDFKIREINLILTQFKLKKKTLLP